MHYWQLIIMAVVHTQNKYRYTRRLIMSATRKALA